MNPIFENKTMKQQGRKPVKTPATSTWYKGKHLTRVEDEYIKTALVIRVIIATGIRTSDLPNVTVEAVKQGYMESNFMNNMRKVILPDDICERLLYYAHQQGIMSGPIFLTFNGKPCGRTAMFHAFGKLATAVGMEPERLTGDALRKYYSDKHIGENGISAVQSSMGYKLVNYFVDYNEQDDATLLKNLDGMLDL